MCVDNMAFRNRANAKRQFAVMTVEDVFPPLTVEQLRISEVLSGQLFGLVDITLGEVLPGEIFLEIVLQSDLDRVFEHAATRFQIAVDDLGVFWILSPVSQLVAVSL